MGPSWRDRAAERLRPAADRLRAAKGELTVAQVHGAAPEVLARLELAVAAARRAYHRARRFGPGVG